MYRSSLLPSDVFFLPKKKEKGGGEGDLLF